MIYESYYIGKIVCIDNINLESALTIGKIYEGYKMKGIDYEYLIKTDNHYTINIKTKRFILLSEWRNNILNDILNG